MSTYRAKRLDNGEWVEGNLIRNKGNNAPENPDHCSLTPIPMPERCWIVGEMLESHEDHCILAWWQPVDPAAVEIV